MEMAEFKQRVRLAFGANMEHATPANVREFVDGMQREQWKGHQAEVARKTGCPNPPLDLTGERALTYEGTLRKFFRGAIDEADDQAFIALWMFALDLAYSGVEEMQAERLAGLFVDDQRD